MEVEARAELDEGENITSNEVNQAGNHSSEEVLLLVAIDKCQNNQSNSEEDNEQETDPSTQLPSSHIKQTHTEVGNLAHEAKEEQTDKEGEDILENDLVGTSVEHDKVITTQHVEKDHRNHFHHILEVLENRLASLLPL